MVPKNAVLDDPGLVAALKGINLKFGESSARGWRGRGLNLACR